MSVPLRLVPQAPARWPRALRDGVRGFLAWWAGRLADALPVRVRDWSRLQRRELLLQLDDDRVEICIGTGAEQRTLGVFGLRAADAAAAHLQPLLRETPPERLRAVLRLPPGKLLVCRLQLPSAARKNLRQVLAYELDRHTPFSADQAYFDYRTIDTDDDRIDVTLYVIGRDSVQQALQLARRLGVTLHAIGIADARASTPDIDALNLLPAELRPPRHSRRQRLDAALAVLAALLLAVNFAIPYWHQAQRLALLAGERDSARTAAEAAFSVRDRRDALLASLQHIREHRRTTPSALRVLDELSTRLPDDTWLQRFEMKNGQIHLQGESAAASPLLRLLQDSPLFDEVSFSSPVTQDPRSGQERFQIAARLREGEHP